MIRTLIDLVQLAFQAFQILILARVLLSWFNADPYSTPVQWLHRVTEPFLAPVRRRLPATGAVDWSPLVVILIASALGTVIVTILRNLV